jgi:heat shock protein HslJ
MNKKPLIILIILVATGLILSACASQAASPGLAGTSWKLVSYGPVQKQKRATPGIRTNLDFGTNGTFSGNMGCNAFSGNFEEKNGNLVISQGISTMMACQGSKMDQERITLRVLNNTVRFTLHEKTLVIYSADGASAITLSK